MRLKRKTYQENKEIKMNKTNKKQHPRKKKKKENQPIFPKYFSQEVYLFVSYESVKLETSTLWNDVIYYVLFMCHFLVKAIVIFKVVKVISFSIFFNFPISAIRLFIFISCFSLDLYTHNLNINRI